MLLSLSGLCDLVHQCGVVGLMLTDGIETEQSKLLKGYLLALLLCVRSGNPGRCGHLPVLPSSSQRALLVGDDLLEITQGCLAELLLPHLGGDRIVCLISENICGAGLALGIDERGSEIRSLRIST